MAEYLTDLTSAASPMHSVDEKLHALSDWLKPTGLPKPELDYEVCGPSGEVMTVVDLAWPNGVQEGCSQPVALVLPEVQEQNQVLNQAGYRFFNSGEGLRLYLETLLDVGVETPSV